MINGDVVYLLFDYVPRLSELDEHLELWHFVETHVFVFIALMAEVDSRNLADPLRYDIPVQDVLEVNLYSLFVLFPKLQLELRQLGRLQCEFVQVIFRLSFRGDVHLLLQFDHFMREFVFVGFCWQVLLF